MNCLWGKSLGPRLLASWLLVMGSIAVFAACSSTVAQNSSPSALDENRLWEVERLVVQLPSDSIGFLDTLTPAEAKKEEARRLAIEQTRMTRIRTEPGLAPYLVALADRYIKDASRDGLPMIFHAIALRSDIPATEIERFLSRTEGLLQIPGSIPQSTSDDLLVGMAQVLAAHPSERAEAILIKMLHLRDDFTGIRLKLAAGEAIAASHMQSALGDMQATARWFSDFSIRVKSKESATEARIFEGYVRRLQVEPTQTTLPGSKGATTKSKVQ